MLGLVRHLRNGSLWVSCLGTLLVFCVLVAKEEEQGEVAAIAAGGTHPLLLVVWVITVLNRAATPTPILLTQR